VIRGSNNIALRNVHVHSAAAGDATAGFFVIGSPDHDALEVTSDGLAGRVEILLPVTALPWREMATLERWRGLPAPYRSPRESDRAGDARRTLEGREVSRILGAKGIHDARVAGSVMQLAARDDVHRIVIPEVRIAPGAKMPIRVRVRSPRLTKDRGWLHVGQRSGGKLMGGVSLEVRADLHPSPKYDVRREGDRVNVAPRSADRGAL
jgi:hypothetical protein